MGFDPVDPKGTWRVGDRVLFGVCARSGDRREVRFVRFTQGELPPDLPSELPAHGRDLDPDPAPVRNAVRAVGGEVVDGVTSRYVAYEGSVAHSVEVFDAAGRALDGRGFIEPAYAHFTQTHLYCAVARTVGQALTMILNTPMLDEILQETIRPPSMWSVLTSGGVEIRGFIPDLGVRSRTRIPGRGTVETRRIPVRLFANGTPCLNATMDVTAKQVPFLYCHGVVALRAQHPDDARRGIEIRLLGARRGPASRRP
jgi:hypothetical protein